MHPDILPKFIYLIDPLLKLIKSDPQTRKSASDLGRLALINKDDLIKYCKKFEIKCIKQSTVDIFKVL